MTKRANPSLVNKYRTGKVGDLYFMCDVKNDETGEIETLEIASGTFTSTELTKTVDEGNDIIGGRDSSVLYTIPGKTEVKLDVTDAFDDLELEAIKFGGASKKITAENKAQHYKFHMPKTYPITRETEKLQIKLSMKPRVGEEVAIYKLDGTKIDSTKYTLTNDIIEFTGSDLPVTEKEEVRVTGFKADIEEGSFSPITSGDTSLVGSAIYEIPVFNDKNQAIRLMQFIFYKAKLDSNVSISGKGEDGATEAKSTLKIMKDLNRDTLGEIVTIDL